METLEIHSKDFLVKWVHASDNSFIDWQVKPLKKSINFAIYKKNLEDEGFDNASSATLKNDDTQTINGSFKQSHKNVDSPDNLGRVSAAAGAAAALNSHPNGKAVNNNSNNTAAAAAAAALQPPHPPRNRLRSSSVASVNKLSELNSYKSKSRSSTFSSNLNSSDLTLVQDYNKLVAEELVHGQFEIQSGGMFAFIFDNSFSKTTGKKVLFSSKIIQNTSASSSPNNTASTNNPVPLRRNLTSQNSQFELGGGHNVAFQTSQTNEKLEPHIKFQPKNEKSVNSVNSSPSATVPGNNNDIIPGSYTSASDQPDNVNFGSGNILRPKNGELLQSVLLKKRRKKLQGFTKRFFVLNFKYGTLSYFRVNDNNLRGQMPIKHSIISADAKKLELILDSGMEIWNLKALNQSDFDAWVDAFNQVKQFTYTDDSDQLQPNGVSGNKTSDDAYYDNDVDLDDKSSSFVKQLEAINHKLERLKLETASSSPNALASAINGISNDVNSLIIDFKAKKSNKRLTSVSRNDAVSVFSSNDFYDAQDYIDQMNRGVVLIGDQNDQVDDSNRINNLYVDEEDEDDDYGEDGDAGDDASSSSSSDDDETPSIITGNDSKKQIDEKDVVNSDDNLYPLPHSPVNRDSDIPICNHEPLSILGILRKNVGKDLTSIPMPVEMNEPVSILQKYAELIEYCDLINNAISANCVEATGEKILRIASFAVSYLSSMRAKERNSRKPFNPLLGETFELVREDFGIRLISEKVSHRPPVFAMYVESNHWNLSFSPAPAQKFWGKNAEITTKGNVTLSINTTGEIFTWNQPSSLLKNIIAGEKYSEPSSSITVKSNNGQKAVVEFAKGGMFSGRSEDLTIKAFDAHSKKELPYTVEGKWTETLTLKTKSTEKLIWTCGKLLPNSQKKFGFTEFAGTLNKITELEKDQLAPTDSRLRPDMKAYEGGDLSTAERVKNELEEDQRQRRKVMENEGKEHEVKFFHHVGDGGPDSGEWVYNSGEKSYWNRRKNQDWDDLLKLW